MPRLQDLFRLPAQLRRVVDQVVRRHALPVERQRAGGEGLGRRGPLAGHVGRRHGAFLDRPDRPARLPVENEAEGLLRHLSDGPDPASADGDIHQVRRAGQVVVPQAVMDDLEVPDPSPRARVQADQAFREEIVPLAMAAVPVVRGRAHRQVDVAELRVVAHRGPDVRVAGVAPRLVLPRLVAELAGLRHGVEGPELPAGAHVEAAHVARRHLAPVLEVVHRAADHHDIAADDRRGGDGDQFAHHRPAESLGEIDAAPVAEGADRPSRASVQRDEVEVVRSDEDAAVPAGAIFPVSDPAVDVPFRAWIVDPERPAGDGIDRRDLVEGGAGVEHAVHEDRGGLVGAGTEIGPGAQDRVVHGVPAPRDPQAAEVLRPDLVQGRVTRAGGVGSVDPPLAGGRKVRRPALRRGG